jgi:WD40 repeat protein
LYTGSDDATARLWDLETGTCLRVFKGHHKQISCLDLVVKGGIEGHLFTGSWDCCIRKFDPLTGEMLMVFRGHTQPIYCIQVVEDTFYTGSRDGTARSWDCEV